MAERSRTAEGLRRANTARVLRSLRDDGAASRVELATRTGLSKATVGVIVAALEDLAVLAPATEPPPTGAATPAPVRGRPSRPVGLDGAGHVGIGLELNVDYVAASVVDLAGRERLSLTRPVEPGTGLAALGRLAGDVLDVVGRDGRTDVVGATVAVPGLVRGDEQQVAWTPNLSLGPREPVRTVADVLGPDVAGQVERVGDLLGRAVAPLGAGRAVGVVAHPHGDVRPEHRSEERRVGKECLL